MSYKGLCRGGPYNGEVLVCFKPSWELMFTTKDYTNDAVVVEVVGTYYFNTQTDVWTWKEQPVKKD